MRLLLAVVLVLVALFGGIPLALFGLFGLFVGDDDDDEAYDIRCRLVGLAAMLGGVALLVGGIWLARVCVKTYNEDHQEEYQQQYMQTHYSPEVLDYYDEYRKLPECGILTLHYPEKDMQYVVALDGVSGSSFKSIDGVRGKIDIPYEIDWGISEEERLAVLNSDGRAVETEKAQYWTETETEDDWWTDVLGEEG